MKCYNCNGSNLTVLWASKTISLPKEILDKIENTEQSGTIELDISNAPVINKNPDPQLFCNDCWHNQ